MNLTPLSNQQLAENFSDLHPNYSADEAAVESSRCLYCYDAPCTRACPTHIDVPRFIRQIAHQNLTGAARTIFESNILGGSCARACPTEVLCEGACVDRVRSGEPVQIGRLQRYATDFALEQDLRFFSPGPPTGSRVAVVGSGPAGLSCAHELRRLGHEVAIFESRDVPGGLNTLGIAAYKITRDFSLSEIEPILDMGIDLQLNHAIDRAGLESLLADFDAVFLAIGLGKTSPLNIPGEEAEGVWEALEFIEQMHGPGQDLAHCKVGRHVVVIGAGNTAIDAATAAVRLGAESVIICYRRSAADMSAYDYEYELAKSDGIAFQWHLQPIEFIAENGQLTGVRFERTNPPLSSHVVGCDMVIKSLGQSAALDLLVGLKPNPVQNGRVIVDPKTFATPVPGLYSGGDCVSSGAEIVNAVQEGKLAARSIHDAWIAKKKL